MSVIPPPPPQPTYLIKPNINSQTIPHINININLKDSNECIWASDYPELQEACIKNRICLNSPPHKYHYREVKSILQDGPTCGLVALSIILNEKVSAEELLTLAKERGYSNNGEMFSCFNMKNLTEMVLKMCNEQAKVELKKSDLSSNYVIDKLLNESLMLVPYDADYNHSPCLKLGHKAHWAAVCGIIVPYETLDPSNKEIYLLCKHGKSKHLAVWSLAQLELSNKNLYEFSPKRGEDNLTYVLPEGGIGGPHGLCDQFIIIEGLRSL